jgi:hypothetical protein
MTAETSPGLKLAADSFDLGMVFKAQCSMSMGLRTLSSRPAKACSLQSKYPYEDHFQGQQTKPSNQTLHGVRTRHVMAQSLGQKLGSGFVLLRGLQKKQIKQSQNGQTQ